MKVNSIELIIRTQLLICKCYSNDMAKYQYPAYKMLLSCVRIPLSIHGQELRPKRLAFSKSAVELIFHTCLVSPLNATHFGVVRVGDGGCGLVEMLV